MARRSSGGAFWVAVGLVAVILVAKGHHSTPGSKPLASGDARKLAAQVLALPNDIVLTSATRSALSGYAKTGKLTNFCGDTPFNLDPLLLRALLKLQHDGYRVLVNNLGIGSDRERRLCYDRNGNRTYDQHVRGRAVDLNGIIKKGGGQTSWGHIGFWSGAEMRTIQSYADAWLALLPHSRGGVGQEGCLNGEPHAGGFHVHIPHGSPNPGPASFPDACNHLHLDVRDRR